MSLPWEPPEPWEPEDAWEPENTPWEPPYPPPSEYHLYKDECDDDSAA